MHNRYRKYSEVQICILKRSAQPLIDKNPSEAITFLITVGMGYCDYHLVTLVSVLIGYCDYFPNSQVNFSTVALLPCDYLLVILLDIVTILAMSQGSHNIQCLLYPVTPVLWAAREQLRTP